MDFEHDEHHDSDAEVQHHNAEDCICDARPLTWSAGEKDYFTNILKLQFLIGVSGTVFNNGDSDDETPGVPAKSSSDQASASASDADTEERQRGNRVLQSLARQAAAERELNGDAHAEDAHTPRYRRMLQVQTQRLNEWVLTREGAWRSVQALQFNGLAALVAVAPSCNPEAQWRIVLLSEEPAPGADAASAEEASDPRKIADWPSCLLHAGWTLPHSGVFDFSGITGDAPAPRVDSEWSAQAFYDIAASVLDIADVLPHHDDIYRCTLNFSALERVHLEGTHDPGPTQVTLIERSALVTKGVDLLPCVVH